VKYALLIKLNFPEIEMAKYYNEEKKRIEYHELDLVNMSMVYKKYLEEILV
jgi:hypothetical protein